MTQVHTSNNDSAALLAPSVKVTASIYADPHAAPAHCVQSAVAVVAGSSNIPAPSKASPSVKTAMSAIYIPSDTAAQCPLAPSSSLASNC